MTEYMRQDGFHENVERIGVVPVVVLEKVGDAVPMGNALSRGGLPAAEVERRAAAAAQAVREIRDL